MAIRAQIHRIIYVSHDTAPMSSEGLADLLDVSRTKNRRLEVTGLLLYEQRHFFQVLEGSERNVAALYASIRQDPRHTDVRTLVQDKLAMRQFAQWSMAYTHIAGEEKSFRDGYRRITTGPLATPEEVKQEFVFIRHYLDKLHELLLRKSSAAGEPGAGSGGGYPEAGGAS